jgi:hypothetical protein
VVTIDATTGSLPPRRTMARLENVYLDFNMEGTDLYADGV